MDGMLFQPRGAVGVGTMRSTVEHAMAGIGCFSMKKIRKVDDDLILQGFPDLYQSL